MGRRPAPPIRVRYTQTEALAALQLPPGAPLIQYAEGAGIEIGPGDTLSETQIRRISDYLDTTMDKPDRARALAALENALLVRPPKVRRGGLNPEAVCGKRSSEVRG